MGSEMKGIYVGQTVLKTVHPGTSSDAYTAGDAIGTSFTIPNAVRTDGGGGMIIGVSAIDKSNQKKGFDVYLFQVTPASSDIVDNAAPALADSDLETFLGRITVADSDFTTPSSDKGEATLFPIGLPIVAGMGLRSVGGYVLTRGTPTHASTDDFYLNFIISQD